MTFLMGGYTRCWCKAKASPFLQSGSVIIMRRSRRAVGMCEITALGDFQGLGEGWETGQFHRPVFHAFHQAVISTAGAAPIFGL